MSKTPLQIQVTITPSDWNEILKDVKNPPSLSSNVSLFFLVTYYVVSIYFGICCKFSWMPFSVLFILWLTLCVTCSPRPLKSNKTTLLTSVFYETHLEFEALTTTVSSDGETFVEKNSTNRYSWMDLLRIEQTSAYIHLYFKEELLSTKNIIPFYSLPLSAISEDAINSLRSLIASKHQRYHYRKQKIFWRTPWPLCIALVLALLLIWSFFN
ncbi:MAG: hypothetical protein ACKO34_04960 [Vampirovibrionales bacterium]